MLGSVAGKVMWVGRATVFVVGLSMILAVVLSVASTALAGNLDPLKIGSLKNVATKTTALVGKVATGSAFMVKNPSGGSALGLQVNAGQAPLTVNPEAGTATNLDADKLDGKDSNQFLGAIVVARRTDVAVPDSQTVSAFAGCATGERIIGGSANLDAVTPDSLINVSRPSKDNVGVGNVPLDGEAFSFWKGTATNAPGGDTASRTMRVFAFCTR